MSTLHTTESALLLKYPQSSHAQDSYKLRSACTSSFLHADLACTKEAVIPLAASSMHLMFSPLSSQHALSCPEAALRSSPVFGRPRAHRSVRVQAAAALEIPRPFQKVPPAPRRCRSGLWLSWFYCPLDCAASQPRFRALAAAAAAEAASALHACCCCTTCRH